MVAEHVAAVGGGGAAIAAGPVAAPTAAASDKPARERPKATRATFCCRALDDMEFEASRVGAV
eukprot:CAMPEP_0183363484 /NCGR_PEP_ID=MMETSP0164_2-20130417/75346_1 /TAXON_ID=221442 /ORGANISM="Coccolithus pelagicus ssp braarudi, Strain PLY182g" /LENGTH=62 /DNA_ID=CAMNT_0025538593 /DNA_START=3 /DNA_END=187 /DNA_ORIENTATION=-